MKIDNRFLARGRLCLAALLLGSTQMLLASTAEFPTSKVNITGLAVTDTEVTVGQLHSATGTRAISETGSIQAEQLAIEQINAMGGVLGRKIKIIVEDGASDWPTFAEKAKKLLVNDKVAVVMGCWTSASRNREIGIHIQSIAIRNRAIAADNRATRSYIRATAADSREIGIYSQEIASYIREIAADSQEMAVNIEEIAGYARRNAAATMETPASSVDFNGNHQGIKALRSFLRK